MNNQWINRKSINKYLKKLSRFVSKITGIDKNIVYNIVYQDLQDYQLTDDELKYLANRDDNKIMQDAKFISKLIKP